MRQTRSQVLLLICFQSCTLIALSESNDLSIAKQICACYEAESARHKSTRSDTPDILWLQIWREKSNLGSQQKNECLLAAIDLPPLVSGLAIDRGDDGDSILRHNFKETVMNSGWSLCNWAFQANSTITPVVCSLLLSSSFSFINEVYYVSLSLSLPLPLSLSLSASLWSLISCHLTFPWKCLLCVWRCVWMNVFVIPWTGSDMSHGPELSRPMFHTIW